MAQEKKVKLKTKNKLFSVVLGKNENEETYILVPKGGVPVPEIKKLLETNGEVAMRCGFHHTGTSKSRIILREEALANDTRIFFQSFPSMVTLLAD